MPVVLSGRGHERSRAWGTQARRATLSLSLLVITSCSSSRGTREPWVYAPSRGFYGSTWSHPTPEPSAEARLDDCAALIYVAVIAVPFVLDTVFLPITVPHDVFFVD